MHFSVTTSPHIAPKTSVSRVMRHVLLALIPGVAAMTFFFGVGVLVNIAIAIAAGLIFEALGLAARGRPVTRFLRDNTAIVTAVLFALCLPPTVAWWVTVVGMGFAILLAKQLYGGIGSNPFNPAMVGFVVVIICFPAELALWLEPINLAAATATPVTDPAQAISLIFSQPTAAVDAYTGATPLAAWDAAVNQEQAANNWLDSTATWSSVQIWQSWATIALCFFAGGIYLTWRRFAAWQSAAGVIAGITALATLLWLLDPTQFIPPWTHLLIGGAVLAAFFIVTDPVSGCTSNWGRWWFGLGVGSLMVILRTWSNYPDGVAFAVLLMNLAAPLIDHYSKPRVYGTKDAKAKPSLPAGGN